MEYAVIIDYSTGEIYSDEMDEEMNKISELGTDEFLKHYKFNPDECYVMWTTVKPKLKSFRN